jgi:site-specific recombinase XerD
VLTDYFVAPYRLAVFRGSAGGKYMDGFAAHLREAGYGRESGRGRIRGASHLAHWLKAREVPVRRWDDAAVDEFEKHLRRCRCGCSDGGDQTNDVFGARRFMEYLRHLGVVREKPATPRPPPILEAFCSWMRAHRGVTEATLSIYVRVLLEFLRGIGPGVSGVNARSLRSFVVRSSQQGPSQGPHAVSALRMFVRHLVGREMVPAALLLAIPAVAAWRLSRLPRYLPAQDIEKVIRACDRRTAVGIRDRAILLLLARLGLRAGDVAALRLTSIDWQNASVRVDGKSRREVRLPVPQDVGDAILTYVDQVRPAVALDHVFIRQRAPLRSLSTDAVTEIARRALVRAGVVSPVRGAHVFRHSAATGMLRGGASLEEIGRVLRHSSSGVTAHYAKVDVDLLREVVQPWPEAAQC